MAKTSDKKTIKTQAKKGEASEVQEINPDIEAGAEQFYKTVEADRLQQSILEVSENKGLRNAIFGILGLVAVAVVGLFGYQWYVEKQEVKAQKELFPAQFYFEKDSLNAALKGDASTTSGVEKIADDYSITKAGDLAAFYEGVAYLKEGKFNEAIESLKQFSADDYLVQARAYSLIGDAYMELENADEAITYYKKAANHYPNDVFTPEYLMKLALAYEVKNDFAMAAQAYETIIENHKKSDMVNKAKRALGRAESMKKKAA
ncbi:tetratricopeptide repeat protein [Bernardetia sp.]|uniref:tetratricopeptide repeat protein n=1 Tax=Bernardetia sp. TaxID=1937974 RepID=UPI0025C06BF5|nr:tetratricopeptide repeat protein [Bernardetia sp.]